MARNRAEAKPAPTPEVKASPAKGNEWRELLLGAERQIEEARVTIALQDAQAAGYREEIDVLQRTLVRVSEQSMKAGQDARDKLLAATTPATPPARDTSDEAILRERVKVLQSVVAEEQAAGRYRDLTMEKQRLRIMELEALVREAGAAFLKHATWVEQDALGAKLLRAVDGPPKAG